MVEVIEAVLGIDEVATAEVLEKLVVDVGAVAMVVSIGLKVLEFKGNDEVVVVGNVVVVVM